MTKRLGIGPLTASLVTGLAGVVGCLGAVWLVGSTSYPFLAAVGLVVALQGTMLVRVYRREGPGRDRRAHGTEMDRPATEVNRTTKWNRRSMGVETEQQPFTAATAVTMLRAGAIAVLAGFLLASPEGGVLWLPAVLYAIAAGLDAIDGILARLTRSVTHVGTRLDTEVDAIGLLVGATLAVRLGMAPVAYLLVGLARYGFVAGIRWRQWRGKPVRPLPPSRLRRINAGTQMAVVVLLLAPYPGTGLSRVLAAVAMVPFLLVFLRDWLYVTGRLNAIRW